MIINKNGNPLSEAVKFRNLTGNERVVWVDILVFKFTGNNTKNSIKSKTWTKGKRFYGEFAIERFVYLDFFVQLSRRHLDVKFSSS
jgi:hypothetical protein